jgi:hypothetical protein
MMSKKKTKRKAVGSQKKPKQRLGKCFTKSLLVATNKAAEKKGFNRQLKDEWVSTLPEDVILPIQFTLLHQHARCRPAEPHVRCVFVAPGGESGTIDCTMDLYDLLPGVAELTPRLPGMF